MRVAPGIDAFGGGGFRIAGARYDGSVLILEDLPRCWRPLTFSEISEEDLDGVMAAKDRVEFLLLGTGPKLLPPPKALRERLRNVGIGLEAMSTPEACRLYNVLSSEGRRIAAGLVAV